MEIKISPDLCPSLISLPFQTCFLKELPMLMTCAASRGVRCRHWLPSHLNPLGSQVFPAT